MLGVKRPKGEPSAMKENKCAEKLIAVLRTVDADWYIGRAGT